MNAEIVTNCVVLGFDCKRIQKTISLLGLEAEHGQHAERLRSEFIEGKAEALVSSCLDALAPYEDFLLIKENIGVESFKERWIDYLCGFGQNFDTPKYFEDRLGIAVAWAHKRVPLGVLHLQHCLIQQALVDSLLIQCKLNPKTVWPLVDCIFKITSLSMYLTVEGYHLVEVDELQKTLDRLNKEASQLHQKVATDQLTGVLSYSTLMDTLERQVNKAKQNGSSLCVVMADLDFFKKVNDTYGHLVGDIVLKLTARRIQAAIRSFDMIGRFGGEEFVIILENTDLALAKIIAERIRLGIAGTPFHAKKFEIDITISLGMAMLKKDDHLETLLERADAAMYKAKKNGRNRVAVADNLEATS
ncbi:GGDEF domain-containing protein [Nitrosomonas supralitoralis]|uniref:diguanylate cyclase n=2 Tax=Nitrosomonas supralitoralis TaxID=2116706 RepID=A0A2P7NRG4_9PROT|nr:GGDEF domain-containing protein [Nitrosomonas supralitoralis]